MHNLKRLLLLLGLVMSLLTACAMGNSDPSCICPPIRKYDKNFQKKLADEIKAAPTDAAFPAALQDYALIRLQLSK